MSRLLGSRSGVRTGSTSRIADRVKLPAGQPTSADLTLINRATMVTRKSNPIDDIGVFFTGATIKF